MSRAPFETLPQIRKADTEAFIQVMYRWTQQIEVPNLGESKQLVGYGSGGEGIGVWTHAIVGFIPSHLF